MINKNVEETKVSSTLNSVFLSDVKVQHIFTSKRLQVYENCLKYWGEGGQIDQAIRVCTIMTLL